MSEAPLNPVGDGRGPGGRFAAGNRAATGNPYARRVQRLRAEFIRAVTPADLADMIRGVMAKATGGDVAAFKEICDRLLGRSVPSDLLERIERLEAQRDAGPGDGGQVGRGTHEPGHPTGRPRTRCRPGRPVPDVRRPARPPGRVAWRVGPAAGPVPAVRPGPAGRDPRGVERTPPRPVGGRAVTDRTRTNRAAHTLRANPAVTPAPTNNRRPTAGRSI